MTSRKNGITAFMLCVFLLLCLVFSPTALAADADQSYVAPNDGSSYTVSIPFAVDESEPYAGIQFKLTLSSASDLAYTFTLGSDVTTKGAIKYTPAQGVHSFGFWSGSNAFSGELTVGTLDITYTGNAPQTITITEMMVVRLNESTNKVSDTLKAPPVQTISISREGGAVTPDPDPNPYRPPTSGIITVEDEAVPLAGPNLAGHYFDDVTEVFYSWALEAVDALAEAGVVMGTGPRTYSPAWDITRGDFMLMLARLYDLTGEFDDNFADVPVDSYYYDAIGVGKMLGIAKGTGGDNYEPTAPITRQDMMTLIDRTLETLGRPLPEGSDADLSVFSDVDTIYDYARPSVATLVHSGIIIGSDQGVINPLDYTTRAEIAVVVYRLLLLK